MSVKIKYRLKMNLWKERSLLANIKKDKSKILNIVFISAHYLIVKKRNENVFVYVCITVNRVTLLNEKTYM